MRKPMKLKSAALAPMSIDPRDMVERLTIQGNELLRFSWQYQDNGPVPDEVLQKVNVKQLKQWAAEKLKRWEQAMSDVGTLGEVEYIEHMKALPLKAYEIDPERIFVDPDASRLKSYDDVVKLVAEIAAYAMLMEQVHQRMMTIIDPYRGGPTPMEQDKWDQQALDLAAERERIRNELHLERRRLKEERMAQYEERVKNGEVAAHNF